MKRFRNISFLSLRTTLIFVVLLFIVYFLLSTAPTALAGITSTNFELKDYGFGAGGIATSSSTNYMFQGIAGEIESASLSSTNFRIGPGLTHALQPNIPPAPTFTNPSNYYNKLKLVINTGGNSTDTTYAIAVSNTTSSLSTLDQDSFTESGSGLASLSTHTAEIGGTWSSFLGSPLWQIDKTNDIAIMQNTSGTSTYRLGTGTPGDVDLYATSINGSQWTGVLARIYNTNNAYGIRVSNDSQMYGQTLELFRYTSGGFASITTVGVSSKLTDTGSVRIHFQVSGSSPTSLKVRVWNSGGSEPGTWDISQNDSTANNQSATGGIGIYGNRDSTGGQSSLDDFLATNSSSQTTTNYVQTDNTLGTNSVWQTYTAWGGASGVTIIGLDTGNTYSAQVAAKRGTFTQGGFGPSATASTINPSLTFSLQTTSQSVPPFSVDIGQLNAGTVTTSTDKVTATISTNANNGGFVYLYGTNAGLKSTTAGNYNIGSVSNDLSSILEGYGARGTTVTQTSGGPMELISPYNGAGNNVGIIDTTKRTLSDSTSQPVTGGQTSFELQAKAKNTTPSATDYVDTLTVIGTGSF